MTPHRQDKIARPLAHGAERAMRRAARFLGALALGLGTAAAAEVRPVDDADALEAALRAAEAGDVIEIAGGAYGPLHIRGVEMPDGSPLVLRAVDAADPPRFSRLRLGGSQNVTLQGLVFDYEFAPGDKVRIRPFNIGQSRGIVLSDILFDGDVAEGVGPASNGFPAGFGLSVRNVEDITIENSEFRTFWRGISMRETTGAQIVGNDLHSLRMDGMNFAQVFDLRVEGNQLHDFDRSADSRDHADMIQFWTAQTSEPSERIVIRGNLLNSGDGLYTQSIFMRNERLARDQWPADKTYRDVTIEDNLIINAHLHGISVGPVIGLRIRNNTLVHNPDSDGDRPNQRLYVPRINVGRTASDVEITGNVTSEIRGPDGQSDWRVEDNLMVQNEGRMRPNFYGTVFVGGDPADPASYAPLPGGPLDGAGIGAGGQWR